MADDPLDIRYIRMALKPDDRLIDVDDAVLIVLKEVHDALPHALCAENVKALMLVCKGYLARTETD